MRILLVKRLLGSVALRPWVVHGGVSLPAKLGPFLAVVHTAGASRDGFGSGDVVACFLYPWDNGFSTDLPLSWGGELIYGCSVL